MKTDLDQKCMVHQVGKASVVLLEKATPANCGAKAAACAQLATAATKSGFKTPAGVCVPFRCMEAAVKVRSHFPCTSHTNAWNADTRTFLLGDWV